MTKKKRHDFVRFLSDFWREGVLALWWCLPFPHWVLHDRHFANFQREPAWDQIMTLKNTVLFLTLTIATLSTCQGNADLVAHWTGDNTANDATGNGHDGSLFGGTTYAGGVVGDAFSFDGFSDAVIVNANTDLEPSTISIAMWVQTIPENHIRLLADSTHGAGNAGWALQINSANNLSFAYGNGSGFPEITTSAMLGDGQFHHYAATLDGTDMRLYVDGALQGTLAYTNAPAPSGRDIQLGHTLALSNRSFEGLMDDVRIYNHALSAGEVTALFSVPEPASASLAGIACLALIGFRRKKCSV